MDFTDDSDIGEVHPNKSIIPRCVGLMQLLFLIERMYVNDVSMHGWNGRG